MPVDFIFQFVLDSSGCYNDRLSHHKGEKSGQKGAADNNSYVDKNLLIETKTAVLGEFIYRLSYKLYFIYVEKIAGNDEE